MTPVSIKRIEQAVDRCRHAQPAVDFKLGPDLRVLATISANMSVWTKAGWHRMAEIDLDTLSQSDAEVVQRWLVPEDVSEPRVCRLGISGGDVAECEACQ